MRQLRKCSHVITAAFLDLEKVQKTDLKTTAACRKCMKSSTTIAASSVCKQGITDRLNKMQLRTVWCSIFYFCSKQTSLYLRMNMCWLFLKNSFHKLSCNECKNSCFEVLLFVVWLNWVLRKFGAIKSWIRLAYDDFREKTWLDHGTKTTFFT